MCCKLSLNAFYELSHLILTTTWRNIPHCTLISQMRKPGSGDLPSITKLQSGKAQYDTQAGAYWLLYVAFSCSASLQGDGRHSKPQGKTACVGPRTVPSTLLRPNYFSSKWMKWTLHEVIATGVGRKGLLGRTGSESIFENTEVGKTPSRRKKGTDKSTYNMANGALRAVVEAICLEATWGGKGGGSERGIPIKLGRVSGSPGAAHGGWSLSCYQWKGFWVWAPKGQRNHLQCSSRSAQLFLILQMTTESWLGYSSGGVFWDGKKKRSFQKCHKAILIHYDLHVVIIIIWLSLKLSMAFDKMRFTGHHKKPEVLS